MRMAAIAGLRWGRFRSEERRLRSGGNGSRAANRRSNTMLTSRRPALVLRLVAVMGLQLLLTPTLIRPRRVSLSPTRCGGPRSCVSVARAGRGGGPGCRGSQPSWGRCGEAQLRRLPRWPASSRNRLRPACRGAAQAPAACAASPSGEPTLKLPNIAAELSPPGLVPGIGMPPVPGEPTIIGRGGMPPGAPPPPEPGYPPGAP